MIIARKIYIVCIEVIYCYIFFSNIYKANTPNLYFNNIDYNY